MRCTEAMVRRLPGGRVTFAFVDVVESTKTFTEHGEAFVQALAVLQERVARHTASVGGSVVKTDGDGAFLAFGSAQAAIDALSALQAEVEQQPLAVDPRLRVRAGVHTGDAVPVADDYVALAVNVAARVTSTANAGQVVVSSTTHADLSSPAGDFKGDYDLKDVADPVGLWLVCGDGAPLRGLLSRRTNVRGADDELRGPRSGAGEPARPGRRAPAGHRARSRRHREDAVGLRAGVGDRGGDLGRRLARRARGTRGS